MASNVIGFQAIILTVDYHNQVTACYMALGLIISGVCMWLYLPGLRGNPGQADELLALINWSARLLISSK